MTVHFGRSLMVVGMVASLVLGANGQSKDTDTFHFSIGGGAAITDNRDSEVDSLAENNTDLFISPRIEANIFGDSSVVNFHYAPEYRMRDNPSDIQNDSELYHDLGIDFKTEGAVTDWRVIEQFALTDDPAIESAGSTLRRDSSFTLNNLEIGMNHEFTDRTALDLSGKNTIKSYDDELRSQESDENNLGIDGTLYHKLAPETAVIGLMDATSYGYENSDTYDRDFESFMIGGGLDRLFLPGFRGGVRGGMQSVQYNDSQLESKSLPFVRVAVTAGQGPALRLNAYANLAIANSEVYPFASQEETEFYGLLEYNPGESRTSVLGLMATLRTASFDEDQLPDGGAEYQHSYGYSTSGSKDTMVLEGSFTCYFGEMNETSLKLAQRMEDVSSDVSLDYTRNSTTVSLAREF